MIFECLFKRARAALLELDLRLYRARVHMRLARKYGWPLFVAFALLAGCQTSQLQTVHEIEHRCHTEIAAATTADQIRAIEERCDQQINEVN